MTAASDVGSFGESARIEAIPMDRASSVRSTVTRRADAPALLERLDLADAGPTERFVTALAFSSSLYMTSAGVSRP